MRFIPGISWQEMIGADVAGRYRLRTLLSEARTQAEYAADRIATTAAGKAVAVTLLELEAKEKAATLAEMRAASRLSHRNILRILDIGEWRCGEQNLLYLVTESVDKTLDQAAPSMTAEKVTAMSRDILAGLRFLHGRGFVYCNLEPDTTVKVEGDWKLGDLGRLCPAGASGENKSRVEGARYTPPEAEKGTVGPEWDVWAFGKLIREILPGTLPRPFHSIVPRCLDADPRRRPSLADLESALAPPAAPEEEAAPAGSRIPVESSNSSSRSAVVAAVLLAACAGVSILWWRGSHQHTEPATPAVVAAPRQDAARTPPEDKPSALGKTASDQPRARRSLPPVPPATHSVSPPPVALPAQEAVPRQEAARPAETPQAHAGSGEQEGRAEWFSSDMEGRPTASGEPFRNNALVAADGKHPMGTRLRVTNPKNGRSVIVKVNDRGKFRHGHIIRLTRRAATDLGLAPHGAPKVRVEVVE